MQAANKHSANIETVTRQVRDETVRIVDEQIKDLATQMQSLDDYVTRARAQNMEHHDQHMASLSTLSSTVENSYNSIGNHFTSSFDRVHTLGNEMAAQTTIIKETLSPVYSTLHEPLAELRQHIIGAKLKEYTPTGETPQKQQYTYPNNLPRTAPREQLINHMRVPPPQTQTISTTPLVSPTKIPVIFHDSTPASLNKAKAEGDEDEVNTHHISSSESILEIPMPTGLRETTSNHHLPNDESRSLGLHDSVTSQGSQDNTGKMDLDGKDVNKPNLKRNASASGLKQPSKLAKRQTVVPIEGKENVLPSVEAFSKSMGAGGRARRSPRNA